MAKTAKAISKNSRAARRATSPSINTDKSLKDVDPPDDPKRLLQARHGAGVTKRKAKSKQMTKAQKARQERTLSRAESVVFRLEKKKEKSANKGKTIKYRSGAWEDVNAKAGDKSRARRQTEANLDEDEWEDAENVAMADEDEQSKDKGAHLSSLSTHAADPVEAEEPGVW